MNEPGSKIGELIQEAGCTCEKPPECLADHTCLAGMAEMEWQALNAEQQYLRIRCKELTFDRSEAEVIRLRERIVELEKFVQNISDHRESCQDYDRDMGHEPREFIDDEEWERIEEQARELLK